LKHSLLVCIVSAAAAAVPRVAVAAPAVGFDPTTVETRVDPCVDFYAYACGGWKAKNPLPSDHARFSRFEELDERNTLVVRDILEKPRCRARNGVLSSAASAISTAPAWTRRTRTRRAWPRSPPTWPPSTA
jgi:hypothetical protein